jgi:pimeloyl-ACP methyl ester carboxylesterase
MKNSTLNFGRSMTIALGCALLAVGCVDFPQKQIPEKHILMADASGLPVDPTQRGSVRYPARAFTVELQQMSDDIYKKCGEWTAEDPNHSKVCRIVIFVHGGLNDPNASRMRAVELTPLIERTHSYPIFIDWDSSFLTTYADHLFKIHKGLLEPKQKYFFPFIFGIDEAAAAAQFPSDWYADLRHNIPFIEHHSRSWQSSLCSYRDLQRTADQTPHVHLNVTTLLTPQAKSCHDPDELEDGRTFYEKAMPTTGFFFPPTLVSKLIAGPLAVSAMGGGAWDVMYRRSLTLFETEEQFAPYVYTRRDVSNHENALLRQFLDALRGEIIPKLCDGAHVGTLVGCPQLEITLIGHSMGTIVIDQWLRAAPDIELANIVFMAGATSVRDYEGGVLDYLRRQAQRRRLLEASQREASESEACKVEALQLEACQLKTSQSERSKSDVANEWPKTQLFQLTLHPETEVAERNALDFTPRGSLLVWIDNFYSRPVASTDRTVGRFFNLMPELWYIQGNTTYSDILDQIHVKVFQAGQKVKSADAQKHEQDVKDRNPQKHGDFTEFPFWLKEFWDPAVPLDKGPVRCKIDNKGEQERC